MLVVIVPQKLLQLVMEKQHKLLLQPLLRHLHLQQKLLLQPLLRHLHLQQKLLQPMRQTDKNIVAFFPPTIDLANRRSGSNVSHSVTI
jgi:hypothetical protein